MSHDLKSPLTSIRAYTEALLDGVARMKRRSSDICKRFIPRKRRSKLWSTVYLLLPKWM